MVSFYNHNKWTKTGVEECVCCLITYHILFGIFLQTLIMVIFKIHSFSNRRCLCKYVRTTAIAARLCYGQIHAGVWGREQVGESAVSV